MNPRIEIYNKHLIFFNFDNGLRLRAPIWNGIVHRPMVFKGRTVLIESCEKMGSDTFADFLHEVSNYNKKQIRVMSGLPPFTKSDIRKSAERMSSGFCR